MRNDRMDITLNEESLSHIAKSGARLVPVPNETPIKTIQNSRLLFLNNLIVIVNMSMFEQIKQNPERKRFIVRFKGSIL